MSNNETNRDEVVFKPVQVKNRSTNTTELHASLAAFAKSLDEHPNTIRRALKRSPGKFKDFDIIEVV